MDDGMSTINIILSLAGIGIAFFGMLASTLAFILKKQREIAADLRSEQDKVLEKQEHALKSVAESLGRKIDSLGAAIDRVNNKVYENYVPQQTCAERMQNCIVRGKVDDHDRRITKLETVLG